MQSESRPCFWMGQPQHSASTHEVNLHSTFQHPTAPFFLLLSCHSFAACKSADKPTIPSEGHVKLFVSPVVKLISNLVLVVFTTHTDYTQSQLLTSSLTVGRKKMGLLPLLNIKVKLKFYSHETIRLHTALEVRLMFHVSYSSPCTFF